VTIETSSKTRTLRAYASDLLQYPRWIIEREVDFTDCRHGAHYNAFLSECVECKFGSACRWLDLHRTPKTDDASLVELVQAIESACEYLQSTKRSREADDAELQEWIREAHRFLSARR